MIDSMKSRGIFGYAAWGLTQGSGHLYVDLKEKIYTRALEAVLKELGAFEVLIIRSTGDWITDASNALNSVRAFGTRLMPQFFFV